MGVPPPPIPRFYSQHILHSHSHRSTSGGVSVGLRGNRWLCRAARTERQSARAPAPRTGRCRRAAGDAGTSGNGGPRRPASRTGRRRRARPGGRPSNSPTIRPASFSIAVSVIRPGAGMRAVEHSDRQPRLRGSRPHVDPPVRARRVIRDLGQPDPFLALPATSAATWSHAFDRRKVDDQLDRR